MSQNVPGAIQREGLRPPLGLEELLELLGKHGAIGEDSAKDVAGRATTLRSIVVKDRVGSVRSQAAARYDVTPAEIVSAAKVPHVGRKRALLGEDGIAEVLASTSGVPYHKIDPLRVNNDLVSKTLSRPFARHHVVIPIRRDADGLCLAVIDPFDGSLREQLEIFLQEPIQYVVSSKNDILAVIDRVYGFRSKVN